MPLVGCGESLLIAAKRLDHNERDSVAIQDGIQNEFGGRKLQAALAGRDEDSERHRNLLFCD